MQVMRENSRFLKHDKKFSNFYPFSNEKLTKLQTFFLL